MSDVFRYLLLGLGPGGIYTLLAIGLVLVYRGSGVVNFGAGGFALVGSAIYLELHDTVGTVGTLLIAILATGALGVAVHLLVLRPIRAASPLARVVATLGVTVAIQQGAAWRYGTVTQFVPSYLPTTGVEIAGVVVGADRLIILAISMLLAGVLWSIYRYTLFGIATTAVAENQRATAAVGWAPARISAINWAVGGALAGLAGVLLVPILGFSPTSFTQLIVPALAVAVIAGFRSFPLALVGGIVVGVLESEGTLASTTYPDGIFGVIPTFGLSSSVPFLLIIILMVVRGRALPLRGEFTDRLPKLGTGVPRPRPLIVLFVLAFAGAWIFSPSWTSALATSATVALVGLSVVVVTGYAGQLSLAQFAIAGVGALISSRLADAAGVPFLLAGVAGVAATMIVGLLIALPAVRVRGVNLAVVTMALAVVISSAVLSNTDWNGGAVRGTRVPDPTILGLNVQSVAHPERWAALCLIVLLFAGLLVSNLRRGRTGRRLIAIRDNERAAASLGVNVMVMKLYAFAVGAGLAALGGVLLAFRNTSVDFSIYSPIQSIQILLLTVIGAIGFIGGGVIAGFGTIGGLADQILGHIRSVDPAFRFVLSVMFLVAIVIHPDGFAEFTTSHAWPRLAARLRSAFRRPAVARAPHSAHPDVPIAKPEVRRVTPRRLSVTDLEVRFGGVIAVDHVSFTVEPGEVLGLIGPNGAGKTTVIDAVSGFLQNYGGTVSIDDAAVDRLRPGARARAGLTRSFQSLELFEDLTVADNLRVACDDGSIAHLIKDPFQLRRQPFSEVAQLVIEDFELGQSLDRLPAELSYADRRTTAIARAVAAAPSVLLLDEPAAGLDASARQELEQLIRRLADDWGMAVVLVEHDVAMVMRTCDRVLALNFGREIALGPPEEVRTSAAVVDAYLGLSLEGRLSPAVGTDTDEQVVSPQ